MKIADFLSLLATSSSLWVSPAFGTPLADATALLQSGKFPEAAAALATLPPDAGPVGYTTYLKALSLHLANRQDDAIAAAGAVPADSPWGMKAKFLKGAALTKSKKHREAEAIYAAEAARAFAPARRDTLVKTLLDFAEEVEHPGSASDGSSPKRDWKKAVSLYAKVLDMPITSELSAEVHFRKAMLLHTLGQYNGAAQAFHAWLRLYDPDWSIDLVAGKKNLNVKFVGKARAEARLYLAEDLLALHRIGTARTVAQNLSAILLTLPPESPDKALAGDAAWLRVRTFAPPTPNADSQPQGGNMSNQMNHGSDDVLPNQVLQEDQAENDPFAPASGDIERNSSPFSASRQNPTYDATDLLAELRKFLHDYPAHAAASTAAEKISQTLDQQGKDAETITALSEFVNAQNYQFDPNSEINRKPDTTSDLTLAEKLARRQQSAAFRIGQIHFRHQRYAEAIEQWRKYITAWPNGAEWQQAQSGIVDAEFQTGLSAVATGDEPKARTIFDAFLSRYPLDARARQILFIYGQTRYAAAQLLKEQKAAANLSVIEFQKAIDEWARLITKYPGSEESSLALYNTALIISDEFGRLEDGLAAFKRVTWGNWANPAQRRVELMNSKSLAVATERVFRLSETPTVKVSVRNIEKLKVSRYSLDVEAFFRSRHRMDAIDLLDIDLIAPEKTWEVAVKDYARFRSIQQEIPIEFPDHKAGACIIRVEGEDWQATTLVVRSDIDVLVETARREVLAFVMNGPNKSPLADANILVSDGKKIIATGKTGADGVFRAKPDGIEKASTVRVLVSTPQGMAGSFLSLSGLGLSTVPEKMSRILFDHGHYAPGDSVGWNAIRRDVKEGAFKVPEASDGWKWRAQLPDGRLLYEGPVTWSPQGLCSGDFIMPPSAFRGAYRVRIFNGKESIQANFDVESKEHPPRGSITSTVPAGQAFLQGDVIKGSFVANYSNGLPVVGGTATLTLLDGTQEDISIDMTGRVAYEFPTTHLKPGVYPIMLRVPALDTDYSQDIRISGNEYSMHFENLPEVALTGEPFDFKMKALDYQGRNFATPLKLTIVQREPAKAGRVLEGVPWLSGFTRQAAETTIFEQELKTAATGEISQTISLSKAGNYTFKLLGKDKQGHEVTTETTLTASGGADDSKLRLLSDATNLIAGQPFKIRVQSGINHPFALITVHAQEFFSHQLVALKTGANVFEIPTAAAYTPNFRVTVAALDGRQVHLASRPFELKSGLLVKLTSEGGENSSVKTTDLSGKPVAATVFTRICDLTNGELFMPEGHVVIPTRSTGLSLESSVSFSHPGKSRKLTNGTFALSDNDQTLLNKIQQVELSLNSGNSILSSNSDAFVKENTFLLVNNASKRGVFVINPGLKASKQDALGVDVRIASKGVTDIRWNDEVESKVQMPTAEARHSFSSESDLKIGMKTQFKTFETDAVGVRKLENIEHAKGATALVAWAVDGTSLISGDALVIPASEPLGLHALLPECVTTGQTFTIPIFVINRSNKAMDSLTANYAIGSLTGKVDFGSLAPGESATRMVEGLKAQLLPSSQEVSVIVGSTTWRGHLATREIKVPVILPTGGLFAQGEHALVLPKAEGATGFRLIKALDVAAFPSASLGDQGETIDGSEPQNSASALLQVIAALDGARDAKTKATLQTRLATLIAEIAVTEHDGGGWAWENIDISAGLLTTAFTWRSLLEAKAAGGVVSDMLLKRSGAFVAGRYGGIGAMDFERKSVVLQSMAAAGTADFSLLNPLYRVRETLTPIALVRLCAAFIHAGREDEAGELLALLLKTGTAGKTPAGDDTLYWPGSKEVAGLNAPEEATAAALWSAAKLKPAAPEARHIVNWLLSSQACAPGGSTRCRGQVMQALMAYAKSLPRAAAGDSMEVLVDGKIITTGPGEILTLPNDGKLTIRVKGASPAVVIASLVKSTPPDDPKTWEYPKIASRAYVHDNHLLGENRLEATSTSPVTEAVYGQLMRVVVKIANHPDDTWKSHGNFLQIDEEIPAGCSFVEGSLNSNAQGVEHIGNRLRLRYGPGTIQNVSYEVIALTPGTWTAQGAVLADPYDPARCRRGTANTLTILAPGKPSADVYVMNRDEHMEAARLLFSRNQGADCLTHLDAIPGGKMTQDEERDTARMRLWILADRDNADPKAMIGAFEILTERYPRLVIPFQKLLRVGEAYRRLDEFERAATVFRAALDGAFLEDSGLSVVLEDAGDYTGGVEFQERLWREYPDSQDVIGSLIGLAQDLSAKAPEAEFLPVRRGAKKLEKNALLTRSRDLLEQFTTLYPTDLQVDDAAFSKVNVFFSLKDYPGMVRAATSGAERYTTSPFIDSFKYMAALGYFWQGEFDKSLTAAAPVANGDGKDRDYARYVTAQVYHAQGRPVEAIAWYEKVKSIYEDAAQAIASFEEKRVSLPEVTIFKPGEEVKLTLDYRNIQEGAVQLYKVDLLKLYLREKSLSNITRVDLAGIAPQAGESFTLGDGKDYTVKSKVLKLPVKEEGAYLAIVRGDNLFTSGLVLISPLKLEVKENPKGRVRATVTDAATGKALADAEVKALGSENQEVQSGTTDPRGVFEVGDIDGTSTVIVKQGDNRYAFHRGSMVLKSGTPPQLPNSVGTFDPKGSVPNRKVLEKGEYLKNIDESNKAVQKQQIQKWESKRRSNSKGVEASDVMKK